MDEIIENPTLSKFELINPKKIEKYKLRRRQYIFVVATQNLSVSDFKIEKIFDKDYSCDDVEDLQSLRNAI
jgi:hypothetical protein